MTTRRQSVTILLVEDDDVDAETVKRCLVAAKIANPMVRARDGIEALDMLRGTGGMERLARPYLLLVDIRMPRLDGIGLIQAIRADPELTQAVVFVLTTSADDRDKLAAYNSHVAGYVVKSAAHAELLPLAAMLDYYLLIVAPPPIDSAA